jgi:D-serine deaminase-like pyridoxal phosphate-dependent protein
MLRVTNDNLLGVGDTVRIVPNHVCSTVNLHNEVFLTNGSGAVEWLEVTARGKLE